MHFAMESSNASSSSKRQRLCEAAGIIDLSTQCAAIEGDVPATQLDSDNDENCVSPSDGSMTRMTIRERCDRIVAMGGGVNNATGNEEEQESIENSDEDHDVEHSQVYATPPGLGADDVITATGSDEECIEEAFVGAAPDSIKGPAVFRNSWLLRNTSDMHVRNSTLFDLIMQPPGDTNASDDQELDVATDGARPSEASALIVHSSDSASASQHSLTQNSLGVAEGGAVDIPEDGWTDGVVASSHLDDVELVNPFDGEHNAARVIAGGQVDDSDDSDDNPTWSCEVLKLGRDDEV